MIVLASKTRTTVYRMIKRTSVEFDIVAKGAPNVQATLGPLKREPLVAVCMERGCERVELRSIDLLNLRDLFVPFAALDKVRQPE